MTTNPKSEAEVAGEDDEEVEQIRGITAISVQGYKSLHQEAEIKIKPLTILAGKNSSGKSSMMQPLLLMKQTLEASYDPGALKIDGPNVLFTSAQQFLSKLDGQEQSKTFKVTIETDNSRCITISFKKPQKNPFEIVEMGVKNERAGHYVLHPAMTQEAINSLSPVKIIKTEILKGFNTKGLKWKVIRNRCFLGLELYERQNDYPSFQTSPASSLGSHILKIIHLPGLRGNPERTYKTSAIGDEFPGTFENYVASIVYSWQSSKDSRLKDLAKALETIGLTAKIEAKQLNDTQVELRVGRLAGGGNNDKTQDMVSIADVGLGVSQTLPVLVALLVAEPGQLVYIEQPEIHLHPRAQSALAQVLADAANRGVRVVVETHSSLLILGVQALVAEGKLAPDKVKLHWFQRGEDGATSISSADLDKAGAFGDWPEDFDDVSLEAQSRYLDASEARLIEGLHASNNLEEARH